MIGVSGNTPPASPRGSGGMTRAAARFLDAHVEQLCREHGIVRLHGTRGRAEVRGPARERQLVIRIAPVRGQVSYFVALHEIGHLIGRGRSGRRLEKEAAAWRWALENSLVHPTDAARRSIARRLRSYVQWAELRQHRQRPPVLPPAEADFWALLNYLEA